MDYLKKGYHNIDVYLYYLFLCNVPSRKNRFILLGSPPLV